MGAKRTEYQIVGRYMNGKEVTGYHLQSIETGKSGKYTKEQVCYLVGRDQITNCTGQIYQDEVLLRGKGMSLSDLPVQYEDGDTRNMDKVGKIRRGTDASAAMEQFLIVGTIKSGRNTVGYVIQNAGCGIKKVNRKQVIELAASGKIGNARVQNYQGKVLLRGVNCNLDELPSEEIPVAKDSNTAKEQVIQRKNINNKPNEIRLFETMFEAVSPKLHLVKCGNFMTEEDGQCRFDFGFDGNESMIMFVNITNNSVNACYQNEMSNTNAEITESFNNRDAKDIEQAYKKIFLFFKKWISLELRRG